MNKWHRTARLYSLALRAFPAHHRDQYRDEMIDAFVQETATRAHRGGNWAAVRFIVAALVNAIGAGLGERRRHRIDRSSGGDFSVSTLGADFRHAARSLWKAKGFTAVSVISLGIGIGTVLLIVLFLKVIAGPPPSINAEGMVEPLVIPQGELRAKSDWAIDEWSYPDFSELRASHTGMTIAGWLVSETDLALPSEGSRRLTTLYISPDYFKTVGVTLARGREFDPGDDTGPVVVIGNTLWRTSFGSDPDIVGKSVSLDGISRVVVGLAPPGFERHLSHEEMARNHLYVPLAQHPRLSGPQTVAFNRGVELVRLVARLQPGTSIEQADAAVASIMAGIAARHPATNALKQGTVKPYQAMGARLAPEVVLVSSASLGLAGLVLVVVCLNVSGMVLVRDARREREIAVRLAMGASRKRLIQYLLAESVVLALLGGGLAALVIFGTPPVIAWSYGVPIPDARLRPDVTMALIAAGLSFVTSLIFGLVPAIRFSRPQLVTSLKDEAGGGGRRVGRTHKITTAIQAALAVPFLVICGLKLDNVRTTATADLGFKTTGLYALPIDVESSPSLPTIRRDLEQSPSVESVTIADGLPLDFRAREVRIAREGETATRWVHVTRVDARYLETLGIPLLSGRSITAEDSAKAPPVAVLSEPTAARLFPGGNGLGQKITVTIGSLPAQSMTVIGITGDAVTSQMGTPRPQIYLPLAQQPVPRVTVIARAKTSIESAPSIFERVLPGVDHELVRANLVTGESLVSRSMWDLFSHAAVAGGAASIALALTALGVFGVVGFMVATRTREMGVRIALGASRTRVLGMVLFDTVKLIVPGVLIGLPPAAFAIRQDDMSYYALGLTEPLIYAFAAAVTFGAAMLSALPSARRAAKVEPIIAMKAE